MKTSFNKEAEISDWKTHLRNSGDFMEEDITELEVHLRDEVDHLSDSGLNEEERLLIAKHRIGSVKTLSSAYSSPMNAVLRKLSWALQTLLFLFLFKTLTVSFTSFGSEIILASDISSTTFNFIIAISAHTLMVLTLVWIFRRLMKLHKQHKGNLKPNLFMLGCLAGAYIFRAAHFYFDINAALYEPVIVANMMSLLPAIFTIIAILVIIFKERRTLKASTV